MQRFEYKINPDEKKSGVKVMALVEEGAIESDFIFLNKQKKEPKFVKFEVDGYKNIVAGLALIPDKDILRIDIETEEPYIGYFSAETIETIRDKFMKEKNTDEVNVNHDSSDEVDAFLIESYIVNSELQVTDLIDKGINEATIGSWFTAYKIEDDDTFNKVINGELNGFSVELFADRYLESFDYNNYKKNKLSTMATLFNKLKSILSEFEKIEDEDVKLEDYPIPDKEIIIRVTDVGAPVEIVGTDDAGEEVLEPASEGEYVLEDGRIVKVDADGNLIEIMDAPADEEPAEEEMKEDVVEAVDDEVEVTVSAKQALQDLGIDFTQDGWYMVEVGVENGEPIYGTVSANTYKELKFNKENFEAKIDKVIELEAKIVELEAKIKKPISEPDLGLEDNQKEIKTDLKTLKNWERIAIKNNIPIE